MPFIKKNQFGTVPVVDSTGKPLEQGGPQGPSAPKQTSSGESGTIDGASGGAVGAATGPAPTGSSRFANLQKYMQANKNFNKEGGGMAGLVAGNINNASKNVMGDIGNAKGAFDAAAGTGRNAYDEKTADAVVGNLNGVATTPPPAPAPKSTGPAQSEKISAPTPPPAAPPSSPDLDTWDRMRDKEYSGPQNLAGAADVSGIRSGVRDVNNLASYARDNTGRFNVLQTMFGKAGYNKGQQRLDAAMMRSDPNQLAKLNEARASAVQADRSLQSANEYAETKALENTQEALDTQRKIMEKLGLRVSAENKTIADQEKITEGALKAIIERAQDQAKQGFIDPALLKQLGLTAGQSLYGLNLAEYFSGMSADDIAKHITAQGSATSANYNNIAALQRLAGGKATEDMSKLFTTFSPEQAAKAGTTGVDYSKLSPAARDALLSGKVDWSKLSQEDRAQLTALQNSMTKNNKSPYSFASGLKSAIDAKQTAYLGEMSDLFKRFEGNTLHQRYKDGDLSWEEFNRLDTNRRKALYEEQKRVYAKYGMDENGMSTTRLNSDSNVRPPEASVGINPNRQR